jgi:hypothetical protein
MQSMGMRSTTQMLKTEIDLGPTSEAHYVQRQRPSADVLKSQVASTCNAPVTFLAL